MYVENSLSTGWMVPTDETSLPELPYEILKLLEIIQLIELDRIMRT